MEDRVRPFSDEQARALINLRARYEALIEAERGLAALPYNLVRKKVGQREYLYEVIDRKNNGKSLGPLTPEREQQFGEYRSEKHKWQDRRSKAKALVEETYRIARPLRLPLLAEAPGPILREIDKRRLFDGTVLIVGTNCLPAYMLEAGGTIRNVPDETADIDLAWSASERQEDERLWQALKAVDPTFTLNTEREFQARNRDAYEVELLVAPSRAATLGPRDKPRPIPLPEQEWLLLGTPVDQVVPCRDGSAARLVAPDPRWFALHKLWLGRQAKRNPLKRRKDLAQGDAVLDAVAEAMPQYPLDDAFVGSLPPELAPLFKKWRGDR
ncbi:GSU2403 family nucleotidyltransferase fold protein [Aurantiacibacter gangjinensis]|uniref:Nucleotidyltransferase-like domain-containing protein n=1 Tax=Aurantiacibacter gangjinensis TaxID=502682 RepID=A0A0G9MLX4_9SPHN|nr:GSU2403 family nucleotidyltransferase fold protein [Aurantiacibacter gangjinensis]APE27671.1 hypothetical protein BMF35_a0842 [Aurantiacibacter gangjinensis]KLE31687.1 hypothetical protein AAW01_09205 [Aurantiacibacter gangjinensis]